MVNRIKNVIILVKSSGKIRALETKHSVIYLKMALIGNSPCNVIGFT
jgi:hypothetical protein